MAKSGDDSHDDEVGAQLDDTAVANVQVAAEAPPLPKGALAPMPRPAVNATFEAVKGARDHGAVAKVVRGGLGAVRKCYGARLQSAPTLRGTLRAIIDFGADGGVRRVGIDGEGLQDAALRRCVSTALKGLELPASDDEATAGRTLVKLRLTMEPK